VWLWFVCLFGLCDDYILLFELWFEWWVVAAHCAAVVVFFLSSGYGLCFFFFSWVCGLWFELWFLVCEPGWWLG